MGLYREFFGESKSAKVHGFERQVTEFLDKVYDDDPKVAVFRDDDGILIRWGSLFLRLGFVGVGEGGEEDCLTLLLYAELARMPKDGLLPFYRSILELNADPFLHGRLAIQEDIVVYVTAVHTDLLLEDIFPYPALVSNLMIEADGLRYHLIQTFGVRAIEKPC
jgi:hypothetical protein